jgi:hypothetical protein
MEVFIINKNNKICSIMLFLFICIFICTSCTLSNKNVDNKSADAKEADIYNTVKEIFLTDKGYNDELSKYVSKDVFERTNIYCIYNVNSSEYKKPFKVDFYLKEDSQTVKRDLVYVEMHYSAFITDSQNKAVGGSGDVPITFTVKKTENGWYIIDKHEAA